MPMSDERIVGGYITTAKLGSGWAALHIVRVQPDDGGGTYEDIQQTGVGRYATQGEAADEAKGWAASEGLELKV